MEELWKTMTGSTLGCVVLSVLALIPAIISVCSYIYNEAEKRYWTRNDYLYTEKVIAAHVAGGFTILCCMAWFLFMAWLWK